MYKHEYNLRRMKLNLLDGYWRDNLTHDERFSFVIVSEGGFIMIIAQKVHTHVSSMLELQSMRTRMGTK